MSGRGRETKKHSGISLGRANLNTALVEQTEHVGRNDETPRQLGRQHDTGPVAHPGIKIKIVLYQTPIANFFVQ